MRLAFLALVAVATVWGDVYLQGPRGSNNRLNEEGRERNNGNRMFDSQNNNRGGYNHGNLYYYTGSTVQVEWTNQHSCGNVNNNCELVLQYMCGDLVRDGTTTNTIPDDRWKCDRANCDTDMEYGMHEDYWYYKECKQRYRNKGLYTADQKMKEGAYSTRQNNGGTRRGYECPEERDHYPYWHPTHWRDIAVFTNDVKRCDYYKQESQNVKNKGYCKYPDNYLQFKEAQGHYPMLMNNKAECEEQWVEHGGEMVQPVWMEKGAWNMDPPACLPSPWSRDNHHGNNMDGFMNNYNWTVPEDILHKNCALRLRYNITAGELPGGGFDSSINATLNAEKDDAPTGIDVATTYGLPTENDRGYYFQQDAVVKVFDLPESDVKLDLEVTLNTNQYGRTFEDRTHVFEIRKRPDDVPENAKIHNLNVRGKRGNIVQTYPGVEYDYQPNRLEINQDDYLHIQWTGADSNPGNNAGQGRARTDRNNIVPLREITWPKEGAFEDEAHGCFACNYPELFTNSTSLLGLGRDDLMALAYHSGNHYFGDIEELDDTGTHFDLGLRQIKMSGIWRFLCTRNNNFTNRSQKGEIRVVPKSEQAERA
ncbi:protein DD3-3-like [Bolinopsis microptera]|uniref:protein DD3-3-like n=1 Tax=Bolinopsis microptera TaxID=2820187 RepID=UPI003078FEA8